MIEKITENPAFSQEFKNAVSQMSAMETSFESEVVSGRISGLPDNPVFQQSDTGLLEQCLEEYCSSDIGKLLNKIRNNINFEESSGYDRRRIAQGYYISCSSANYSRAFLSLYKDVLTALDAVLQDSNIVCEGFAQQITRHKNHLKSFTYYIRWAENKHVDRSKTSQCRKLEKECFEFFGLLVLLNTLKKETNQSCR